MATAIFNKDLIKSIESNLLNRLVKHKHIGFPKLNLETLNLNAKDFEFINIFNTKESLNEVYLKPGDTFHRIMVVTLNDKNSMKDSTYTINQHNVHKAYLSHALLELAFGLPSFDNVYYEDIENLTDKDIILKQLSRYGVKVKTKTTKDNIDTITFSKRDTVFTFRFVDNILVLIQTNNPYLLPREKGENRRKFKKSDWLVTTNINCFDVSPKYILGLAKRLSEI